MASFFDYRTFNFRYSSCLDVDFVGRSEGLVLIWKKEVDFEVLYYSSSVIYD